jgi:hypothetical protein
LRNAKVDNNQKEIVTALRRCGAIVKHVHQLKKLFDILVYFNGKTYSVEIKQDKKKSLTPGELECKEDLESVGVKKTMKKEEYRFKFDSGWHINLLLQSDNLKDAKKRFKRYYKKDFNGEIERVR